MKLKGAEHCTSSFVQGCALTLLVSFLPDACPTCSKNAPTLQCSAAQATCLHPDPTTQWDVRERAPSLLPDLITSCPIPGCIAHCYNLNSCYLHVCKLLHCLYVGWVKSAYLKLNILLGFLKTDTSKLISPKRREVLLVCPSWEFLLECAEAVVKDAVPRGADCRLNQGLRPDKPLLLQDGPRGLCAGQGCRQGAEGAGDGLARTLSGPHLMITSDSQASSVHFGKQ